MLFLEISRQFHKAGKSLSFWRTFIPKSLPRVTRRMFSYFNRWNRLLPKMRSGGSRNFRKTIHLPEKQTASHRASLLLIFWWPSLRFCPRWRLDAGSLRGSPAARRWSQRSSGWKEKGKPPVSLSCLSGAAASQSKQRYWEQRQGDDIYILNPS